MKRLVPAILAFLAVTGAAAQAGSSAGDETRARLLGVLTCTRLTVDFNDVPVRDALASLSAALGTPIVGRYSDDRFGHGIPPEMPVVFAIEDVPALIVLEMILDQCALYEPCTWQLRKGYIEVGTKDRLSFPSAVETRVYTIGDLLIEAPYFASERDTAPVTEDFDDHPYKTAALTRPVPLVPARGGRMPMGAGVTIDPHTARKGPERLLQEIVEGIVETVEPGNWDWGQDGGAGRTGGLARRGTSDKIARLRVWEDSLVIRAPDYIHRQVGGYPRAIRPAALTERERRERSDKATTDAAKVSVLGTGEGSRP